MSGYSKLMGMFSQEKNELQLDREYFYMELSSI